MNKELFSFYVVSNQFVQPGEFGQADWLGAMVVREVFDLRSEYSFSWLMPIQVSHKTNAGLPDIARVDIDGGENTK